MAVGYPSTSQAAATPPAEAAKTMSQVVVEIFEWKRTDWQRLGERKCRSAERAETLGDLRSHYSRFTTIISIVGKER